MLPPGLGGNKMSEEPSFSLQDFALVLASGMDVAWTWLASNGFSSWFTERLYPPIHGSTRESLGGG